MSKIKQVFLGLSITAFIIVGTLLFLFVYEGSTGPIEKVANQFKPESSWSLESNNVVPPRFTCLGGNPCPSVHRVWKTGKNLTKEEFKATLQKSGWNFSIEDDCIPPKNVFGSATTTCSTQGTKDDFEIEVHVQGLSDELDKGRVILFVR